MASAGGVAGTLLGSVLPLLPPYLPVFAALAVYWRSWGTAITAAILAALLSPAYLPFAQAFTLTIDHSATIAEQAQAGQWQSIWDQYPIPALGAALGVVFAVIHAPYELDPEEVKVATRKDVAEYIMVWLIRFSWGVIIAFVGLVMMTFIQAAYKVPFDLDKLGQIMRSPWLPSEELALADGSTQVGYTISNSEGWFTILVDQPRTILYFKADSVKARTACTLGPTDTTPPFLPLRGSKITATRVCDRHGHVAIAPAEQGGPSARTPAAPAMRAAPSAAAAAQAAPKSSQPRDGSATPLRRAGPPAHQCQRTHRTSCVASNDRPGRWRSDRHRQNPCRRSPHWSLPAVRTGRESPAHRPSAESYLVLTPTKTLLHSQRSCPPHADHQRHSARRHVASHRSRAGHSFDAR